MPVMPLYENEILEGKRNLPVTKANELVRKARHKLTAQQQKIILYLISQIKPQDEDLKIYKFKMKEFAKLCGIQCNGKNYQNFKDSLKDLSDKSFWIETPKKDMLIRWLERVEIDKYETTVSLRLDERLKPYLLQLQENFTAYNFGSTLLMTSKYSIRLLEIFSSYLSVQLVEFTLEELKDTLECGKYAEYKDFRRCVIDKAISEINKFSDITVSYKPVRQGRFIHSLLFYITEKDSSEKVKMRLAREAALNGKEK